MRFAQITHSRSGKIIAESYNSLFVWRLRFPLLENDLAAHDVDLSGFELWQFNWRCWPRRFKPSMAPPVLIRAFLRLTAPKRGEADREAAPRQKVKPEVFRQDCVDKHAEMTALYEAELRERQEW